MSRSSPRVRCLVGAVCAAFLFGACSDDPSPPDDGKGSKGSKLTALCATAAFQTCALAVLDSYPLSDAERESLSSCDAASEVQSNTSMSEAYGAARAAVFAECRQL